jgi:hypothetical protein
MKRIPQPRGERGSLRWIQHFVNNDPDSLNAAIGLRGRMPRYVKEVFLEVPARRNPDADRSD